MHTYISCSTMVRTSALRFVNRGLCLVSSNLRLKNRTEWRPVWRSGPRITKNLTTNRGRIFMLKDRRYDYDLS